MRVFLAAAFALASVDAATRVAVVEIGKSGTVRRTTSRSNDASPDGVASFWSALHGYGRKLQHAGMPVVPDLFSRPESGVVVGLTGVDLDNMPQLNALMTEEGSNGVVGHMEVAGQHCNTMLRNVDNVASVEPATLDNAFKSQAAESGISALKMQVTSEIAADVDSQIAADLEKLRVDAAASGKTVIVHIIVEEDDGAARRRRLARRLSEDEEQEEGDEENNDGDEEAEDEDGEGNQQQANGFYGYGYYNSYGEWVTPYKTMFQIQYFNVVLWTALGLIAALFFAIYLMINMPMMADTLLFGQSALAVNAD
eukprot:CAMPEP_0117027148 /NCGR_PEP_ID=MMETSP0472-20121206/19876_1 /TAXON_ID=693140 ORGANISM="Tiarina fusus, Strain LIS" /NCGR_SAMPLE_ID=MMETSP0472 /ASSEMBLY_ACC=CAM_ASM_000603 /LENGTH=310 /DNA_ID=CAMNT_0004734323 /DNA_START=12 /DNA_END=944 /DNA_ORIENTATION=+